MICRFYKIGHCLLKNRLGVDSKVSEKFCANECSPESDIIKRQMMKLKHNAEMNKDFSSVKVRSVLNDGQLIILDHQNPIMGNEVLAEKVSVFISSCNENPVYLQNTIKSLIETAKGPIEILVGLDGEGTCELAEKVKVFKFEKRIGKRCVLNHLAKNATGEHFFILDAHCAMSPGWDEQLKLYEPKNAVIQCTLDSLAIQDKSGKAIWKGKGRQLNFCYISPDLKDKWWLEYPSRLPKNWLVTETMGLTGCGLMMGRSLFFELGGYIEEFGKLRGAEGPEWACKTWLSGGMVLLHRKVTCAHLFRQSEPYKYSLSELKGSYEKIKNCFWNKKGPNQIFSPDWLAKRFAPVPKWEDFLAGKN